MSPSKNQNKSSMRPWSRCLAALAMVGAVVGISSVAHADGGLCPNKPGFALSGLTLWQGAPQDDYSNVIPPVDTASTVVSLQYYKLYPEAGQVEAVCSYVPATSPAARDPSKLSSADFRAGSKVTVDVPKNSQSCTASFEPGQTAGYPVIKNFTCSPRPVAGSGTALVQ